MAKEVALILGINGAGGSYLAEYIVQNHPSVEVHGCMRWHSVSHLNNLAAIRKDIKLHEADLLDLGCLIRILSEVKPTRIFNLCANANVRVSFETPLAVYHNNVMSTANTLEAVRMVCPEAIYHHCGTSESYGDPKTVPITENHPLCPVNPYAASKVAQETLVHAYFKSWKLRTIITRMFAYICPRRLEIFSTSFAYQVRKIEEGSQDVLHHGNLDSVRTLIDVRSMAECYWLACEKCEVGVPYNCGGKDVISVRQFLDNLCAQSKVPIKRFQDPALMRPHDVTNQIVDISKFEQQTGWKPRYTLNESIEFLLAEVRKMP